MKVGEKKNITIAPKDGYGESTITQSLPLEYFQDHITQKISHELFNDTIQQTVPVSVLGVKEETLKVGNEISTSGTTAKIIKIENHQVILEMKNTTNPFYGKELKVGLKTNYESNEITITAINDKEVTIDTDNKQNPFYGQKLIVGLTKRLQNGMKITIKSIDDKNVTIDSPNTSELAGKTLIFDVEIISIKKSVN